MPADCIKKTNGPALPSIIGTSSAVRSTNALSIPKPASAESKCSTVDIRALSFTSVVERLVSPTYFGLAGISTAGSRSTLRNMIPVLAEAGRKVRSTFFPVCRPTPVALITFFNVRCLII